MAQADYIYLNGRPVAVLNGSALYYLHDDRLGTPQVATDSSQNTQWQTSYEPFGQTSSVSGTMTQNLRFPGQYFDVESGWSHNGFRDYLPALGRYAEPDPVGRLGSGNDLYVYVGNNPVNFADPLGLCAAMNSAANNPPNNARNTGSIRPMSHLECASYRADKELSIASMTSGSSPDNPVVQAFLGNGFSGVVNLVTSDENPIPNFVMGGWNPGIPGVAAPEVGGYALDGGLVGVASKALLGGATDLFALPKFAYDAATFLGAYAFQCQ